LECQANKKESVHGAQDKKDMQQKLEFAYQERRQVIEELNQANKDLRNMASRLNSLKMEFA